MVDHGFSGHPNTYIFEVNSHLFLVLNKKQVKKIARGGWSGFGMATVGIDPNTFEVIPTKSQQMKYWEV